MLIYIPKYKELYLKDGEMGVRTRIKGEYRAYLYGCDGRLKYDSGWQPNTCLDQAWGLMCTSIYRQLFRGGMALGDSNAAVVATQTGLQGTLLATISNWNANTVLNISEVNGGAPNYESIVTKAYTFDAGNSTGTVGEFVFVAGAFNDSPPGDVYTGATIRVALTTPIVKGASDVLTIEHRTTHYPELADVTGVIDISGVAYNYLLRGVNIDANVGRPNYAGWHDWSHKSGATDNLTTNILNGPTVDNLDYASVANTYYPAAPSPYVRGNIFAGVNTWNKNIRCMTIYNVGMTHTYQIRIGKVSDDSPLEKLNTHELRLYINMYPGRYVP